MNEVIKTAFKRLDWRSYLLFLFFTAVPLIYTMFVRPLFYHGHLDVAHLSLMHNAKWVLFLLVVAAETLFFPLISLFGHFIRKRQYYRITNALRITLLLALVMVMAINILAFFVLPYCSSDPGAVLYMRVEVISLSLYIFVQIPLVFFFVKERKHLVEFVLIQLVVYLLFDLINSHTGQGNLVFLPLGQAVSYAVFFVLQLTILARKYHINIFARERINWHFLRFFYRLANHAFVDAVIIDMILILFFEGIGFNFGIADFNTFETTVLLLPVTSLVILIRADIATQRGNALVRTKIHNYAITGVLISLAWTILIALLYFGTGDKFFDYINIEEVTNFGYYFAVLFIFYNIRALSNVYKAAFYGLGELHYLSHVAIRLAIFIFLPIYIIANETGIEFSRLQIALVTAAGIMLEAILTISYFYLMLRHRHNRTHGHGEGHGH